MAAQVEDWVKYFPFSSPRTEQVAAINFALDSFTSGKRHVVLSCGTGVGKSAIGVTIARWLDANMPEEEGSGYAHGAYFLTTQKILQEQYIRDFSRTMRQVMSSANYGCKFHRGQSCAEGQRLLKVITDKGSAAHKSCAYNCVYKEEKRKFLEAHESITNFSYFMAETNYSGKLVPRSLLVVDEAHNADLELSKFVEIIISEKFATQVLKLEFPQTSTQKQAYKWISEVYEPKLKSHFNHQKKIVEQLGLGDRIKNDFIQVSRQFEMLDKHFGKLHRFMEIYDEDNWIFNPIDAQGQAMRKFEFKPVDISAYSESMLFRNGRRSLMMSATILNYEAHREMLGLKEEETAFLEIPSPFPSKNRPIFQFPIGNMSQGEIDRTLPKLVEAIRGILENHPHEKGIIHCVDSSAMISMSDGTQKPLIEIMPGDEIITWNEKDEKFENSTVLENWDQGTQECVDIHLENGNILSCTPDHRILTTNRGWVQAKDLTIDDEIVDYVHRCTRESYL